MRLLAPNFLLLLPFALIPLLIHLLSRLRLRRVPFPSLLLLQNVSRETFSWLRLKEVLLLILRTLLFLFLVFALSRPYLVAPPLPGTKTENLIIILDDSYSLGYGNRWQTARTITQQLIQNSSRPRLILTSQPEAIFTNKRALLGLLDTIKPSATAGTITPALASASRLIQTQPMPIVVVTDLQQRALPETGITPPHQLIRVINLGSNSFENCGVSRVYAIDRVIKSEVVNYTNKPLTRTVRLKLRAQIEEQTVNLPARGSVIITFATRLDQPGWHTGWVQISPDSLPIDDTRYFAFFVPARRPVLILSSEAVSAHYINLALLADTAAPFLATEIKIDQFRRTELSRYPLLIITDAGILKEGDWQRLKFYLNSNGSVLLIAGTPVAQPFTINRDLTLFGFLRPGGFVSISDIDTTHPILSVFRPRDFASVRFFSHSRLSGGKTLIRLTDGDPLVVAHPGENLIVWAFAPGPEATDLIFKAPFAPLLHRTLNYLAQLPFKTEYTVGDTISVAVATTRPVLLATPLGEQSLTPEIHPLRPFIRVSETQTPGIYRVIEKDTFFLTVNPLPAEGDLTIADVALLQKRGVIVQSGGSATGTELTGLFLYLAVCVFALEMVILALERVQIKIPVRR